MLSDIAEYPMMAASLQISKYESYVIYKIINWPITNNETKQPYNIPISADQVSSVLASVDPLLNDTTMYERMEERAKLLHYMIEIGSTNSAKPGH